MLKLNIYAQGSRVIVVVLEVGAVKTYVAWMRELGKKERQDETHITITIKGFQPHSMLVYFFASFFFCFTLFMTKLTILVLCFPYFKDNSNISTTFKWWWKQILNWSAIGNIWTTFANLGSPWELDGNTMWIAKKWKIPSHPMIQKEKKLYSPNYMLIGYLIFLFSKLLVTIFYLG
jgi:hypothetical protein